MGEPMQTSAQAVHAAESSRHIFSDAERERERERAEQSDEGSGQPFQQSQGDNDGQSSESRPSGLRGGAGGPDELALIMEKLHVAKARPHSALLSLLLASSDESTLKDNEEARGSMQVLSGSLGDAGSGRCHSRIRQGPGRCQDGAILGSQADRVQGRCLTTYVRRIK